MKIHLDQIPPEGLELDVHLTPDFFDASDIDAEIDKPVSFIGKLKKHAKGCLISGKINGEWILQCARCLTQFHFQVASDFYIYLTRQLKETNQKVSELTENDLDVSEMVGDEIDLGWIIREQMILQIPIKPICSESCKGLCPHCGQNLMKSNCKCRESYVDPRFAKLKKLLKK